MSEASTGNGKARRDPVCGREVDPLRARAVGIWGNRTYYFCSAEHRAEFSKNPAIYLGAPLDGMPATVDKSGRKTPTPTPIPASIWRRTPPPAPAVEPPPVDATTAAVEHRPTPTPFPIAAPQPSDDVSGPLAPTRSRAPFVFFLAALALLVGVIMFALTSRH